jgi:urease accessory protein
VPGSPRRPNEGILKLGLSRRGAQTVLHDCYAHVPLRVLRPVYLDDTGTATLYVLNPCGGVVGGDTYTIDVTLAPRAQAYMTTPSATKLYATAAAPAYQRITFTLESGAVLSYLPEQTIPFAQSAFHQYISVHLADGAYIFLGDILAPGRLARQEIFAYREYHTQLCVADTSDDVVLLEHTRFQPQHQDLSGPGLLEGYVYVGTFYALCGGADLAPALTDALHHLLAARQPLLLGSATTSAAGGIAVRLLARDHTSMRQALYDIWDYLYQQVLGHAAPQRRARLHRSPSTACENHATEEGKRHASDPT